MDIDSHFQTLFDNLILDLKASNKVTEVSSLFQSDKDIGDLFTSIWDLKDVHNHLKFCSIEISKNEDKAENFRKEGNKFYQKKKLNKALEYYNKSIIYSYQYDINILLKFKSSHDMSNLNCSDFFEKAKARNLPFGYANRSAVLYELKNYTDCLLDIERAISHKYPTILRSKLAERQAKCFMAQGNKLSAIKVLNETLCNMKTMGLDDEKFKNSKISIEALLKQYEAFENYKNEENYISNNCILDVPSLLKVNSEIPSLSSSVSLSYLPEKGRFLVANEDIMPGEVLIKETSFSHIVLPQSLLFYCSNCIQRSSIPIPCPFCSNVVFCSEECLSQAMGSFHFTECPLLSLLLALDLGKNAMLAFRLITQTTFTELKKKISSYNKAQNDPLHLGFNEDNLYSSEDYSTIYHLVTNQNQRTVSDLFKRAAMAVCLVKLLLLSNYFGHPIHDLTEIDPQMMADITLVGKVLFTHLMNLPCNAHSLTELQVNTSKYQESYIEEVGAGAFGVLSLTNHSCNPSIARSCYRQIIVAKAIQFIPKGMEISDSYGEHYAIQRREERQNDLCRQYYFVCSCEACTHNWPTYDTLPKELSFKCPQCFSLLILGVQKCRLCQSNISELDISTLSKDPSNMNNLFITIQDVIAKYNTAYDCVLNGNISQETLQAIVNVIYWINRFALMPNKLLFEAQETLKHCFDREASHFFIK